MFCYNVLDEIKIKWKINYLELKRFYYHSLTESFYRSNNINLHLRTIGFRNNVVIIIYKI